MKILVISNLYPPFVIGGYEINCSNVVTELRHRGHDVQVLTSPSQIEPDVRADHVQRNLAISTFLPQAFEGTASTLMRFKTDVSNYENICLIVDKLRQFTPDIVFFWNLHGLGGLHIVDLCTSLNIPWSIYLGDRVYEQIVNAAPLHVRSIFRGHDSSHIAAGLSMAVSSQLVEEIEATTDLEFTRAPEIIYGYAAVREPFVEHKYREEGITRFVFAGRIGEHKGISIICDAAYDLVSRNEQRFQIDMYGDGSVSHYTHYVNSLGVGHKVKFHGSVSQDFLHQKYKSRDVFLFPTWAREPFAFAPFEAAAFGCVPILTENCGCAERLVDQVHCIKIERTATHLADAMLAIIQGRVPLERIGRAGASLVRQDLSFAGHVDKIETLLSAESRGWSHELLLSNRLILLAYAKHHLALAWTLGRVD